MNVYLDHNATTPMHPEVLEAMLPYFGNHYGNASSPHRFGRKAREAVEEARARVASALGADPFEIVFLSGGTEADNQAITGAVRASEKPRKHVVTTSIEHAAVLETARALEEEGIALTVLPVDGTGRVEPDAVRDAITEETVLVSVQLANNEVGTLQPVQEIGEICREKGVLFHTDAVQGLGKIPIDFGSLQAAYAAFSAHKIFGPKGTGALYVRRGAPVPRLVRGGHHEGGRRAGTENVPGIVGFGKAVEQAMREFDTNTKRLLELRDRLESKIREKTGNVTLNGHRVLRLPNTLNLGFKWVEGEALLMHLDEMGVAASTGSACASGSTSPSHVLLAMGRPHQDASGAVRFSLGHENNEEEIDYAAKCVNETVARLRAMSPLVPPEGGGGC